MRLLSAKAVLHQMARFDHKATTPTNCSKSAKQKVFESRIFLKKGNEILKQ
jgi:hypothetical protein